MGGDVEELAERFRRQAEGAESRAPLYAAMSRIVAEDDALLGLLLHPPPEQRLPVLFLAAVHLLVLAEPDGTARRVVPEPHRRHLGPTPTPTI